MELAMSLPLDRTPRRLTTMPRALHRAPLVVGLLALAAVGCDDPTSSSSGGDDDGDAVDSTLAWNLAVDPATGLEPGQTTLIAIEGDIPEDAVIWVDAGTDDVYGVPLFQPVRGPSDGGTLQIPVPVMRPGRHTLHLGTNESVESNGVELTVVEPPARRSREEVETLLRTGLTAWARGIESLLTEAGDPETQLFLDSITVPHTETIGEWFDIVAATAEVAAELYAEIPEEDERRFQAMLHHAGVLDRLEAIASAGPAPDLRPGAPPAGPNASRADAGAQEIPILRYFPHPTHRHAFLMDLMAASGHADEVILSVLTIIAGDEFNPAASKAGAAISLVSRLARFGIQTFVPTDIVGIEAHHQAMVFEHQRIRELWWAHLRPQERLNEGAIELAADVVALGMGQAWGRLTRGPHGEVTVGFWEDLIGELLARISTKVATTIIRAPIPESDYVVQVKTVLNPGAFRFFTSSRIIELEAALPAMGPAGPVVAPMIAAHAATLGLLEALADRFESIDVTTYGLSALGSDPLGVEAAEGFDVAYADDEIYFPNLPFTESGPRSTVVDVELRAFHFGSYGLRFLGDIPIPVPADLVSHPIQVNDYPGTAEQDEKPLVGQSIIFDRWYGPDGTGYDWVERSSGLANEHRPYRFFIGDGHSSCQQIDLKASAAVRFERAAVDDGRTELPMRELEETGIASQDELRILAEPGLSRVVVEAEPA
ncbi:MAG: hypothetical protein ACODAA_05325, partial [Gemmatimonadota bacterium]